METPSKQQGLWSHHQRRAVTHHETGKEMPRGLQEKPEDGQGQAITRERGQVCTGARLSPAAEHALPSATREEGPVGGGERRPTW